MKVLVRNNIKMYPVAMVESAQHKLYTLEAHYENVAYELFMKNDKKFEAVEARLDKIHNLLDSLIIVNVQGKDFYYGSYENYSLAKQLLAEYGINK